MKKLTHHVVGGLAAVAVLVLTAPEVAAQVFTEGQTINDCDVSVGRKGAEPGDDLTLEWSTDTSGGAPTLEIGFESSQDLYIEQSKIPGARELTANRPYTLILDHFDASDTHVFAEMAETVEEGEEPDDVPIARRRVDWFGVHDGALDVRITLARLTDTSALMSINFRGRSISFLLSNRGSGELADSNFSVGPAPSESSGSLHFAYEVTGASDDEIEIDVTSNADFEIGQPGLSPKRITVPASAAGYNLHLTGFNDGGTIEAFMVEAAESDPTWIFGESAAVEMAVVGDYDAGTSSPQLRVVLHRSNREGSALLVISYRGRVVPYELAFP